MSLLWTQVTSAFGDAPTDESVRARRDRISEYLDRKSQRGQYMSIPDKFGPVFSNQQIHHIIREHDGPAWDEHWDHLPDDVVSLRQRIHQHQGYVYPEMVKEKLREDSGDDPYPADHGGSWGNEDPKFVRHEGEHYLLDGHHRFTKARLMGQDSIWGKVFDTANPAHRQSNCMECHYLDSDYDHDPDDCPTCREHGW